MDLLHDVFRCCIHYPISELGTQGRKWFTDNLGKAYILTGTSSLNFLCYQNSFCIYVFFLFIIIFIMFRNYYEQLRLELYQNFLPVYIVKDRIFNLERDILAASTLSIVS